MLRNRAGISVRSRRNAGRPRIEIALASAERSALEEWRREPSQRARALRARLILDCADGHSDVAVAARNRTTSQTVGKWRRRFLRERLAGLSDRPRAGTSPLIPEELLDRMLAQTRQATRADGMRWSTRRAAAAFGIGHSTVASIWRRFDAEEQGATADPSRAQGGDRALGRTAMGLRSAVQRAGLELLAAGGLEAVTMASLAERIGVHPRAIYRRWSGVDEILAEVVMPALRQRAKSADRPLGLAAFLRRTAELYSAHWNDAIAPAFLRSLIERRAVDSGVARAAERISQEGAARFLEHYSKECDPGEIRDGLDPLLAPEILIGAIAARSAHGVRPVDAKFLEDLVSILLDGIRSRDHARVAVDSSS